jgi:hypothetical protein
MIYRIGLIGLVQIDLPDATIRLCEGGFMRWAVDGGDVATFYSHSPVFGTIASIDAVTEGVTEAVPALDLTLHVPSTAAPEDLSQPGFQRSRVRFWIGEYAPDDGILVGEPELMFHGQIDQTVLGEDAGTFDLTMSIVSSLERLFLRNRGNSLNPRWHKSIWVGETGHDNATGLGVPVAWGIETPAGANGSAGGGRFSAAYAAGYGSPLGSFGQRFESSL